MCRFDIFIATIWLCSTCGCTRDAVTDEDRNASSRQIVVREDSADVRQSVSSEARFQDVAEKSGVVFTPRNGREAGHAAILESLGTGVAIFDFDQDGWQDLFFPGGGEFGDGPTIRGLPGKLFHNRTDWHFVDVTQPAELTNDSLYSHGAATSDFDNDGFPDLLITGYGSLRLFHNQGDGTFEEIAQQAELHNATWSSSAAWGDINNDGALDLYVANYVDWSFQKHPRCGPNQQTRDVCGPSEFEGISDRLFFNNGDGSFRDGSREAGLVEGGKGLGVVIGDVDADGDADIYVGNDTTPNFLYLNDGTGKLTESGIRSGTALGENARSDGSMGVDLGDYNNDGLPDIWVANFENQSFALYRNDGQAQFQHVSDLVGITAVKGIYVGFGTFFIDFDLDGYEDLFAANGHVMYHSSNSTLRQRPLLFRNQAGRRFAAVTDRNSPYLASEHLSRGAARGDLNNDGLEDIVIANLNEPVAVLANSSSLPGRSAQLRLIGRKSARSSPSALLTGRNAQSQRIQQVRGGGSYLSTSTEILSIAPPNIATPNAPLTEVIVHWPSGISEDLVVPRGQVTVVLEPLAGSKVSEPHLDSEDARE